MTITEAPVVPTVSLPICRHIKVPGIKPAPLPEKQIPVENFIRILHPNGKIEHLGRMKNFALSEHRVDSSSLFYRTVHRAFANHHPLGLRPEVLMYLVNATVAEAVKRNPDAFRSLFTTTAGKQTIQITHNGLVRGDPTSPWREVFPMFNAQLREKTPVGIMNHMLPGFSTSTPENEAASMVAFMDATSPFYDYRVMTMCGIPSIRLYGSAEDWEKLRDATGKLGDLFRQAVPGYFEDLRPVLDTLAGQAQGDKQDDDFWKSIYKHDSMSGGDTFGGWVSRFLYFIQEKGKLVPRGRVLDSGCAPSHVSSVPFVWDYLGTEINMKFLGGILGIDNEDGYLTPALSYAILEEG